MRMLSRIGLEKGCFVDRPQGTWPTRLRAAATLAAALMAAGCGQSTPGNGATGAQTVPTPRVAAKAVLAEMPAPEGFARRRPCAFAVPGGTCFRRDPSITLDRDRFAKIIRALGAHVAAHTIVCRGPRMSAVPRVTLNACIARGTVDKLVVVISAVTVVKLSPHGPTATTARAPRMTGSRAVVHGTEVDVEAMGGAGA